MYQVTFVYEIVQGMPICHPTGPRHNWSRF